MQVITNLKKIKTEYFVLFLSLIASIGAIWFCFVNDYIVIYGDSESHLNIAKRVVDSITPGFAQLGGIWLPLPHLLMLPFVKVDFLWRSGLAGSIISGLAYVISSVFIFKTTDLLVKNKWAGLVAALVFMANPNILYLQSTPMTELLLIAFFTLSSYFFIKFLYQIDALPSILLAAFFGFCAVLTRYDGWLLVSVEAAGLLGYFVYRKEWRKAEGYVIIFSSLAFLGIFLWLVWDYLILGDALYFTHSEFSAKSQQNQWLARGQLPAYHNLFESFKYYLVTAMQNAGILIAALALIALMVYLFTRKVQHRFLILLILATPFIFNVLTLFLGQSVIFNPALSPPGAQWQLFNVRYGVMIMPLVAVLIGILVYRLKHFSKFIVIVLVLAQIGIFVTGKAQVITWEDGKQGLSAAKRPDAERWLLHNYDSGLVLMDDYSRTISVVRSGIPMQNMIYIGNKPYWQESLNEPEKYATWIVMQENDAVWKALWQDPAMQGRVYKYFERVYTSPEITIFRKQKSLSAN